MGVSRCGGGASGRWHRPPLCWTTLALWLLLSIVHTPLTAQVRPDSTRRDTVRVAVPVPTPASVRDSVVRDSIAQDSIVRARILARTDSIRQVIAADTIKTPVARFEMPTPVDAVERLRWVGPEILSTGATNLADLLDRVPGVTTYRSGWLAGLHVASYHGDASRVRLFVDGLELDITEPRNGTAYDLTDIQLFMFDEIVVERVAGEVRVWLRSASVVRTTPFTRVDIFTGDLNTNAFRAIFARRWRNGAMLQFGGQQIATQSGRVSAFGTQGSTRQRSDGEALSFMGRVGWARGRWSVDAFAMNTGRERDGHTPRAGFDTLPAFKGNRRDGYVRVGYGDTSSGFWTQAMSGFVRTRLEPAGTTSLETGTPGSGNPGTGTPGSGTADDDSATVETDTTRSQAQHLLTAGYRTARWSVSLTDRMRPVDGALTHAPALRAHTTWRGVDVGAWAERRGRDSTDRTEVWARARPFDWLTVLAAHSTRTPDDTTGRPSASTLRAEGAVRLRRLWLRGGVLRDDPTRYRNLTLLGAPDEQLDVVASTGTTLGAHGPIYKDLRFDLQLTNWDVAQFNRPKTHVRAELALVSEWRRRFPKGQFGINARLLFDRRSGVPFLYRATGGDADIRTTEVAQVMSALLEIRIQRGTLFYQYRNLTGGQYEQIRGITMPPAVQMYGVRWEFWN